jgi:CRP-like cAMP-binding protein
MPSQRSAIALLDVDPELGEGLAREEHELAARVLLARARVIEPGDWDPHADDIPDTPVVGLLIVDGIVTRDVVFAGRTTTEILGAGDIVRPWEDDLQFEPLPFEATWHVHEPARIAILDARFALAAGRWPCLADAIGSRHVRRARALSFQLALTQLPRVDDRLLVLLWSLAERWGRVGMQGVRLPLRLPHRTLATLVGARRPSVTTALSGLARDGLVERMPDGWLLHGDAESVLAARLPGARPELGALAS